MHVIGCLLTRDQSLPCIKPRAEPSHRPEEAPVLAVVTARGGGAAQATHPRTELCPGCRSDARLPGGLPQPWGVRTLTVCRPRLRPGPSAPWGGTSPGQSRPAVHTHTRVTHPSHLGWVRRAARPGQMTLSRSHAWLVSSEVVVPSCMSPATFHGAAASPAGSWRKSSASLELAAQARKTTICLP